MSGHRSFSALFASLPVDRRDRIDAEAGANLAEIDRAENSSEQNSKFTIYRGSDGLFHWRLIAANGQTLADSGRGYQDRSECLDSIDRLRHASSTLAVEDAA